MTDSQSTDTNTASIPAPEIRKWAVITHLSTLTVFLGIPFANLIAPLIIWILKKDTHPYIKEQGQDCLNFQISVTIYGIVAGILCLFVIGFFLLAALVIFDLVYTIKAAVAANKGESFKYPYTFHLVN